MSGGCLGGNLNLLVVQLNVALATYESIIYACANQARGRRYLIDS